jgi:hypothetical protein
MCGKMACVNGKAVCQNAVLPGTEVCNGVDDNCDGQTDNGAVCPPMNGTMYYCYMGGCYAHCNGTSEFDKCPGGYNCDSNNFCVPDKCQGCTACQRCVNNACVDACSAMNCSSGFTCQCGQCVDQTCRTKGCAMGQRCNKASGMCEPDQCIGAACLANQFCDPSTGDCIYSCVGVMCGSRQTCQQGTCTPDPCTQKTCPEPQICDPSSGDCIDDPCFGVDNCVPGFACVGGACVPDPCDGVMCPMGGVCKFSKIDGTLNCVSPSGGHTITQDRIVGTGGGGFACQTGTGRAPSSNLFAVFAMIAYFVVRRRARGARK